MGVAWGYGGRSSLLLLVVVDVETHQKVILEKGWLWEVNVSLLLVVALCNLALQPHLHYFVRSKT